jgi:hypothetical protein
MGFIEDDPIYVIARILTEIAKLFFFHNRTCGWIEESMFVACNFLSLWRILLEELLGPNGAPLEHVSS